MKKLLAVAVVFVLAFVNVAVADSQDELRAYVALGMVVTISGHGNTIRAKTLEETISDSAKQANMEDVRVYAREIDNKVFLIFVWKNIAVVPEYQLKKLCRVFRESTQILGYTDVIGVIATNEGIDSVLVVFNNETEVWM